MIFMQHYRDFAIPNAQNDFDMPPDQHAQALLRVGDVANTVDHPVLSNVHRVVHQVEQDFIFALKMMVQAPLAQLES